MPRICIYIYTIKCRDSQIPRLRGCSKTGWFLLLHCMPSTHTKTAASPVCSGRQDSAVYCISPGLKTCNRLAKLSSDAVRNRSKLDADDAGWRQLLLDWCDSKGISPRTLLFVVWKHAKLLSTVQHFRCCHGFSDCICMNRLGRRIGSCVGLKCSWRYHTLTPMPIHQEVVA